MEPMKQQMTDYWSRRAEGFAALRKKEFSGAMRARWLAEFRRCLPAQTGLRILDLGTGSGFFALLLAMEGHQVTGIDLTPDMISQAKAAAHAQAVQAEFYVMDAERPAFEPGSFDVLVTRNLTWALPHLADAYRAWHALLRPDGRLINFDADYCREEERPLPENHAHKDIDPALCRAYAHFKDALRPMQQPRPQWDIQLLRQAGFHDICVDTGVWQRIYQEFDEFYNPTPIFTITANA